MQNSHAKICNKYALNCKWYTSILMQTFFHIFWPKSWLVWVCRVWLWLGAHSQGPKALILVALLATLYSYIFVAFSCPKKTKILSCKVGWGKTCATHIWKCTWGAKSLLNISCISSQMRIYPKKHPNLNIAMTLITYPRISIESIQIEYPCYRLRMPATKSFSQRCARASLPEVPELSSTNSQGGCDLYRPISKSKYVNVMSIYSRNIHLHLTDTGFLTFDFRKSCPNDFLVWCS